MNIASKIKVQREAKRYSQEFMASQLKITQASYSRLESGFTKPDIEKLKVLSRIFEVSILHFISND